jgi:hypothetical protein
LRDRRRPRASGGVRLRAGMHGEGRKSGETIGHSFSFMTGSSPGKRPCDGVARMRNTERFIVRDGAGPPPPCGGQSRQRRPPSRRRDAPSICSQWPCFVSPRPQNDRFAFASRKLVLVFRGAVRGGGHASAEARPVQRKPHALGRYRRALGTQRARIDAHP